MILSPSVTKALVDLQKSLESEGFELREIIIDERVIVLEEIEIGL